MDFFRRFASWALWIFLIGIIVSGFLWFIAGKRTSVDTLSLLPPGTAIIFEFADFPAFTDGLQKNNKMWQELSTNEFFDEPVISIKQIDSLLKKEPLLQEFFKERFCISVSLKANNYPGFLFCLPESKPGELKIIMKFFEKQLKGFSFSVRRFEGTTIYDLVWEKDKKAVNFSLTSLKGVLIGSFSSELVEETIRQYDPERNFTRNPDFIKISRTAGNMVPVNIFINYQNTEEVIRFFLNSNNAKDFKGIGKFAAWGGFDAEFFSDKIILNGFSSLNDSLNYELKILKNQEPVKFNCPEFLPGLTGYFKVFGFSDKDLFFKSLSGYLKSDPSSAELIRKKADLMSNFGIDLDKGFLEMAKGEFGLAGMSSGRTSLPFFFMELKSQSLAEQQFQEWLGVYAKKDGRNAEELMLDYKIDNNNTIKVYKLPLGGIPSLVFGAGFKSPGNDYFTFFNNYIVFADSFISLKEFIYQVILGNTLASGPAYSSLGENISSRSNVGIFIKPSFIAGISQNLFSDPLQEIVKKGKESISKFDAISIQYSAAGELFYNRVFMNFSGIFSGNVRTVWESRLDTTTTFKPVIVINHITKEKEIIIQDEKNQLYLLSNAGIVLWKKAIGDPVKSDIYQVDYYHNGKLQYLFSTRNKIYLLDRNGNNVEKFPVEMRSPACAGISVFDYDLDGTIRICVPGEDRKIYMYDKDGKVIPGWLPERTDNEVHQPVQHFRVGGKDFIVAIDKYKFYILDRKGSNRVKLKQYFQVSANNCFYLDVSRGQDLARMVTTDTSGSIMRVYFSGKVEKILERSLDADHYFVFSDLDGDQKGDFLTVSGRKLDVLNHSLENRFNTEFEYPVSFRPVIYKFSNTDNKIGIVLKNPGNIYLYNYNGSLYKGFPLEGAAPFSISSFPELGGRFNMIVGSNSNFLYNYSVQ